MVHNPRSEFHPQLDWFQSAIQFRPKKSTYYSCLIRATPRNSQFWLGSDYRSCKIQIDQVNPTREIWERICTQIANLTTLEHHERHVLAWSSFLHETHVSPLTLSLHLSHTLLCLAYTRALTWQSLSLTHHISWEFSSSLVISSAQLQDTLPASSDHIATSLSLSASFTVATLHSFCLSMVYSRAIMVQIITNYMFEMIGFGLYLLTANLTKCSMPNIKAHHLLLIVFGRNGIKLTPTSHNLNLRKIDNLLWVDMLLNFTKRWGSWNLTCIKRQTVLQWQGLVMRRKCKIAYWHTWPAQGQPAVYF